MRMKSREGRGLGLKDGFERLERKDLLEGLFEGEGQKVGVACLGGASTLTE